MDDGQENVLGRAKGGIARAAALTEEERSEIARQAAEARWSKHMPHATHEGIIKIGDIEIACAVLNTGERLITQSGFMRALGRARQAKGRQYYKGDINLPAFLTAQNLKPFIPKDLEVASSQIEFRPLKGMRAFGYADSLLPEVCDVFVKADRAGKLAPNQQHIADQAHVILKGLARTGIAGLIDEATGYQEVRDKHALQALLDTYLQKSWRHGPRNSPTNFTNTSSGYVGGNGRGAARTRRRSSHPTRRTSCMRVLLRKSWNSSKGKILSRVAGASLSTISGSPRTSAIRRSRSISTPSSRSCACRKRGANSN